MNYTETGLTVHKTTLSLPHRGTVRLMLMSDLHIGSSSMDQRLLDKDLELARAENARIAINGDLFDAILTKDQKRFTQSCIDKRLRGSTKPMNDAIKLAEDILGPYADLIEFVSPGNHEESVTKYHDVDLTALLAERLSCAYQGIGGYWKIAPRVEGTERAYHRPYVIRYHHGAGGASSVNKGIADFQRMGYVADADMLWLGHSHHRNCDDDVKETLVGDRVEYRPVKRVRTGAYYTPATGYAASKNYAPQPHGGMLVKIDFIHTAKGFWHECSVTM